MWFVPTLEKAGIADLHWHDLRHTYATRLILAGVDIYTVGKLMRHRNIQITARYAHLSDRHLSDATEKMVAAKPSVTRSVTPFAVPPPANAYAN